MTTINLTFALSAPARRAIASLSPSRLAFITERFFDTLEAVRYRDFVVSPRYFSDTYGRRRAAKTGQLLSENRNRLRLYLPLSSYRLMKRLESRGLTLTWQLEEMLYFAVKEGLLN